MLIHSNGYLPNEILNASYNYTRHEIDVLLTIINRYRGNNTFEIGFDELLVSFGSSNANNKELKNTILALLQKPLEYRNNETKTHILSAIICNAKIDTTRRVVTFTVTDEIGLIIGRAKEKYSRYNFEVMLNLKSRYAKRIYLHCNAWKKTGVWEVDLGRLRNMLGVQDKYEQFFDFNTKILQPAFAEINKRSEYVVTNEYLKNGKQYTTLLCSVVLKKEHIKEQRNLGLELKKYGLSEWQIKNILHLCPGDKIEDLLNYVRMNVHTIKNTGGFLKVSFEKIGVPLERGLF